MIGDLERAQDLMREKNLDALVAFSASNVFYLTGFHSMQAILSKTPSSFAVLSSGGGEPSLILPADEDGLYQTGEYQNDKRHYYGGIFGSAKEKVKSEGDAFDLIAKELKGNTGKGSIGYDGKIAPGYQFDLLRKALPEAKFIEATNIFERMRVVKTEEEIRRLKKSLSILEWSTSAAFKALREGMTEREFLTVFKSAALTKEPDASFLQLEVGFGPRGGLGCGTFASDYPARKGDVIHFDGGIFFDQYSSDTGRSATLGPASPKVRKIYDACFAAENKAISMLKPGQRISDIYKATLKELKASNFFSDYEASYFGHSIGMEAHEWPAFTEEQDFKIAENMVFMIEIPLYDSKIGAFNAEDCLLVTRDGPEYLTTLDRSLYEL